MRMPPQTSHNVFTRYYRVTPELAHVLTWKGRSPIASLSGGLGIQKYGGGNLRASAVSTKQVIKMKTPVAFNIVWVSLNVLWEKLLNIRKGITDSNKLSLSGPTIDSVKSVLTKQNRLEEKSANSIQCQFVKIFATFPSGWVFYPPRAERKTERLYAYRQTLLLCYWRNWLIIQ